MNRQFLLVLPWVVLAACGVGGGESHLAARSPLSRGCETAPACEAGDQVVAAESGCLQDDAVCYQRESCGVSIWCTGPRAASCLSAPPVCNSGDQVVENESGCLQGDAVCYQRESCGTSIWCTGPVGHCKALPMCRDGDQVVENESGCLQDDAVCYQVERCGQSIWCTGPR